ncbi:hypothetical protein ZWY2020_057589 [Hordeum vulgare]|nr:hypothetical protein ZWY2020_057589 [Hordeum vulgare]
MFNQRERKKIKKRGRGILIPLRSSANVTVRRCRGGAIATLPPRFRWMGGRNRSTYAQVLSGDRHFASLFSTTYARCRGSPDQLFTGKISVSLFRLQSKDGTRMYKEKGSTRNLVDIDRISQYDWCLLALSYMVYSIKKGRMKNISSKKFIPSGSKLLLLISYFEFHIITEFKLPSTEPRLPL